MKTLFFMLLLGVLSEVNPQFANANHNNNNINNNKRYIAHCVLSPQLNQLGRYYEDQLETDLQSTYNSPQVNIRFIKTSSIDLGRISDISEIFDSVLIYDDFNGTPVLSGDIEAKPCRANVPISITIRSIDSEGSRIQTSSRSHITVTGQMGIRSSSSSNSGIFVEKDIYNYR